MAPNNALGNPSAAALRARYEGAPDPRESEADGFGAGDTSVLGAEVADRGVGTAVPTRASIYSRPHQCFWPRTLQMRRRPIIAT